MSILPALDCHGAVTVTLLPIKRALLTTTTQCFKCSMVKRSVIINCKPVVLTLPNAGSFNTASHVGLTPTTRLFCCYFVTVILLLLGVVTYLMCRIWDMRPL